MRVDEVGKFFKPNILIFLSRRSFRFGAKLDPPAFCDS
jgi:hypothetical protein